MKQPKETVKVDDGAIDVGGAAFGNCDFDIVVAVAAAAET